MAEADTFAQALDRFGLECWQTKWRFRGRADHTHIPELLSAAAASLQAPSRLVLIVDGLDYAQRFRTSAAPALHDWLPRPPLDGNVVIVVSAQKIEQLPDWLRADAERRGVPVVSVGQLDAEEVRALLLNHGTLQLDDPAPVAKEIGVAVHRRFAGHVLTTAYAAKRMAAARSAGLPLETSIVDSLPMYDDDIEAWYDRLFEGQANNAAQQRIIGALAAAPCLLTATEAARLAGIEAVAAEDELGKLRNRPRIT